MATLPGGWDLAYAIRLGIKPFAELAVNSGGIERVPSRFSLFLPEPFFQSAPVAMLQSRFFGPFVSENALLRIRVSKNFLLPT